MSRLFAYGTLMYPELMLHLLGRQPEAASARLQGYARYQIRNAPYPGLIAENGASTDGLVYQGLTSDEFVKLDKYESDLYDRRLLSLQLQSGQTCEAWVYVIPEQHRHHLSDSYWDPISWRPKNQPGPNMN